jgi:signal transduction histidine kinase
MESLHGNAALVWVAHSPASPGRSAGLVERVLVDRESVAKQGTVARRSEASPGHIATDVSRVMAVLAKLEADLETLAESGIDAVITPANEVSLLLHGAQEALRQREERYRIAIRATGCVIWDWDETADRFTWTGPMEEMLGYRAECIVPSNQWWQDRIHPDDLAMVRDHFARMREQRIPSGEQHADGRWSVEYRVRRADDGYASVQDVHTFCGVGDREAARMIGAITDITQRKLDTDRLRRSEAHLARAQRLTSFGSFEFDGETGALRLSEEIYKVFGVERETFVHSPEAIRAMIHPADIDGVIGLAQLIGLNDAGLATRACDFRMICPDGAVRVVRRECDPVCGPTGRITGFFGTFQDISAIRAAEEERRELELQLQQVRKMEALGTLAGGIAHDINNTLVPVINLAELVRRDLPEDSTAREFLQVIRQSGERARDLMAQVVAFSRPEKPERRLLDLEACLRQSMRLIRAGVLSVIEIHERIEPVPPVLADMTQMHQVILNLVTNAAQAIGTEIGTITIELAAVGADARPRASGSASDWVRISVADSGCGMDDGMLPRIFDPFFTTKEVGQGTGLGLSVVRGIVTAHGGRIEVRSSPGDGARFDIFLPAAGSVPADGGQQRDRSNEADSVDR